MTPIMAAAEVDFSILSQAATAVASFMTGAWDVLTGNPLTLAYVGVAALGIGFWAIKRGKKSLR